MNNREAFEAWAKDHNPDLFVFDTYPSGIYCDDITYGAWLGYQAGLASQQQDHIVDSNKLVKTAHVCAFSRSVLDGDTETCSCGAWR